MGLQRGDQMMSPGSEPRPGDWLQLPGPEAAMRRSRLPAKSARFASPASPPLASGGPRSVSQGRLCRWGGQALPCWVSAVLLP